MTSITSMIGDMNKLKIPRICRHRHDRRSRSDSSDGRLRSWLWGPLEHRRTGHMDTNLETVQEDRRPMVIPHIACSTQ
jgi:hypothetical protein